MRKRSATMVSCAVLAISCATSSTDTIRSAMHEGDITRAFEIAGSDVDSLDLLAMQILSSGASDENTKPLALKMITRSQSRAMPLIETMALTSEDPLIAVTARSLLHRAGVSGWQKELYAALDSDDGDVRAAALLALSTERTDRVFFEKHVLDPHPDARLATVRALSRIDAPWSEELLLVVASTDPAVNLRRVALSALDPGVEEHSVALEAALTDEDLATRVVAARLLGASERGAGLAMATGILEAPASTEGIYFATAALSLGVAATGVEEYLHNAVSDPRENIRLTTLVALTAYQAQINGLESLATDPSDSVKVAWCRLARSLSSSHSDLRISVLEQILDDGTSMEATLAMAEEGHYDRVRGSVWWKLQTGSASDQRYVIAHASHPFDDTALSLAGMKSEDPTVRLAAAAAWLTRPS